MDAERIADPGIDGPIHSKAIADHEVGDLLDRCQADRKLGFRFDGLQRAGARPGEPNALPRWRRASDGFPLLALRGFAGEAGGLGGAQVGQEDELSAVGEEVLQSSRFAGGDLAVDE
jgi:hypothetical protein